MEAYGNWIHDEDRPQAAIFGPIQAAGSLHVLQGG